MNIKARCITHFGYREAVWYLFVPRLVNSRAFFTENGNLLGFRTEVSVFHSFLSCLSLMPELHPQENAF